MAQSVEYWLAKHMGLGLIPRTYVKAWHSAIHMYSQEWRGGDRCVPGATGQLVLLISGLQASNGPCLR